VISELGYLGGSAIMPYDLQGVLGLKVQRNLFMRRFQLIKRVINILVTILSIPIVLPLFLLFGILIRLDSPGKILYAQTRLGYEGKPFKMLKFRTMVNNADAVLEDHLANCPEAKSEWGEMHKLKDDPRVTRVGRFLRQTSLDELPQLWNVLRGEMSLVGPRPIVAEEITYYGQSYETYKKVKPGMTGLWQVSGRNDTSYENRVLLDEYYVRHWSIWLDFYILMRTLWAVVAQQGAY
jgi:Undecaprenyl-phosphate galactose phosphotransferase WbaP